MYKNMYNATSMYRNSTEVVVGRMRIFCKKDHVFLPQGEWRLLSYTYRDLEVSDNDLVVLNHDLDQVLDITYHVVSDQNMIWYIWYIYNCWLYW